MNNKVTVAVSFTIGFGNNLFQYTYARLLAEKNGLNLSHRAISEVGIEAQTSTPDQTLPMIVVDDSNYKKIFFTHKSSRIQCAHKRLL